MILPIPLFPEWAKPVLEVLPFRVHSGNLAPEDGLPLVAHQLAWTIALVLLGRFVLSRARSRLVVQGG